MRILFASSEVAPFIKTGGLADVAGSLPKALAQEGHDVKVILPRYEGIGEQWRSQMKFEQYYNVTLSWRHVYCGVFSLEQDGVTYWFVDNEYYFKRWQLYGHFDDCERFAYFSRAVLETPGHFGWAPDIIHCNDWQTALVPVYMLAVSYTHLDVYKRQGLLGAHPLRAGPGQPQQEGRDTGAVNELFQELTHRHLAVQHLIVRPDDLDVQIPHRHKVPHGPLLARLHGGGPLPGDLPAPLLGIGSLSLSGAADDREAHVAHSLPVHPRGLVDLQQDVGEEGHGPQQGHPVGAVSYTHLY